MRAWVNGSAPLRDVANLSAKPLVVVPERAVVELTSKQASFRGAELVEVEYKDAQRVWLGWVYAGFIEPYEENYQINCVDLGEQTANPNDAEQYVLYNKARQVNLCGQICTAFCLEMPLFEFLELLRVKNATLWARIFGGAGKVANGTGVPDLIKFFSAAGMRAESLIESLRDETLNRSRYTVSGVKKLLESGKLIASVRIDHAGRLKASGILHWVVITKVVPERAGYGFIELYNPFSNRIEVYSWDEFLKSSQMVYGVYVPNEVT